MIKVTRKKNESFEAMARRFRRHVLNRGLIREAKDKRFDSDEKSRNMRKEHTLTRLKLGSKIQYLRKVGKWEEPQRGRRRRR